MQFEHSLLSCVLNKHYSVFSLVPGPGIIFRFFMLTVSTLDFGYFHFEGKAIILQAPAEVSDSLA